MCGSTAEGVSLLWSQHTGSNIPSFTSRKGSCKGISNYGYVHTTLDEFFLRFKIRAFTGFAFTRNHRLTVRKLKRLAAQSSVQPVENWSCAV